MSESNPYLAYVTSLARLVQEGKQFPLGGFPIPVHPPVAAKRRHPGGLGSDRPPS